MEQNLAYAAQYQVQLQVSEVLPDIELYVDEHRLMQVMTNLISNAVKFSPANQQVKIEANLHQQFLRISVTDHGKGIPEEYHQKIFDKFTQVDSSDSRDTGGTGLGLSISRAIIEQHGGRINFVSQEAIGTTFFFDLPIYDHQTITRIKDQIISLSTPRSRRLLICEDDPDIAGLLQLMLARHGYDSDIAGTTGRAHALLEQHHYDALLLDLLLPDQHGMSLIRKLRESTHTRQLPIIVISAVADTTRKQLNGGAANIIDWLDKPVDQTQLLKAVDQALSRYPEKPHLLYVEDDADLQEVIGLMLQDRVRLHTAANLDQARELVGHNHYDLVLLDIGLPDGSGLELLKQFQHLPQPPATVVFSNQELEAEVAELVSAALLKSTTSSQTLLETITRCLQQRDATDDFPQEAME